MKLKVKDLCSFMESWAPAGYAASWDRVGLHTGHPESEVHTVLVSLSVTSETVQEAKRHGAQMIIAHHPLLFRPLESLREDRPHSRLCAEIIRSNIACFSAHTNLDAAVGGVNDILAEKIGLQQTKPLLQDESQKQLKLITFVPESSVDTLRGSLAEAGAGTIGRYTHCSFQHSGIGTFFAGDGTDPVLGEKNTLNREPELRLEMILPYSKKTPVLKALLKSHPYEEPAYDLIALENPDPYMGLGRQGSLEEPVALSDFAKHVRKVLQLPHLICYGENDRTVQTVAVLGGSGGKLIAAIPAGIDVYVTGDIGHHDAELATARGLACVDAGHWGTELPVVETMKKKLKAAFPALSVISFLEKAPGTFM